MAKMMKVLKEMPQFGSYCHGNKEEARGRGHRPGLPDVGSAKAIRVCFQRAWLVCPQLDTTTGGSALSQESRWKQVKPVAAPQNPAGMTEKPAHSDIWLLSQEIPKRELSRKRGQMPWLFSRSHPNRQELPRRQGTRPRKGVCGRPRWIHCPSALKAHGSGSWYGFLLPAVTSPFALPE